MADKAIYVVLRADLKMPPGKAIAQACHAVLALGQPDEGIIALRAEDMAHLELIQQAAVKSGIECIGITDAGRTVFKEPTVTCIALGPVVRGTFPMLQNCRLY